jgi:hypothetical protein
MIVYHGSYTDVKEIDLSNAKRGKDFGKGFYVTNIRRQAEEWAMRQGRSNNTNGIVSDFEFDYDRAFLTGEYNTKKFDGYTKEWLKFIVDNRKNNTNANIYDYDIIEGPIADDRVNENLPKYEKGEISEDKFLEMLTYDGNSHQICFCSTKSLDLIERRSLSASFKISDISILVTAYLESNDKLSEKEAQNSYYKSETYKNLSDESTGLYNKTWQEIYDIFKKELEFSK